MGSANHSRRAKATPTQKTSTIWDRIQSEEAYEDGHSYSGNFGSKDSFVGFKIKVTPKQFKTVERIVWDTVFNGEIPTTKAQSIERRTIEKIGANNIIKFASIADDKWGPALSIRNHDGSIIFMGMCSE